MPGSITPLPVMQLEHEEDRQRYAALQAPKSIVIRYGYMKMIAELPYDGSAKPGCGSRLVALTRRGIEMGEMLTTTCGNGGCGKSVSRKQMLQYIENSGGKDYPFSTQGKILRVANPEDLAEQNRLDNHKPEMIKFTKALVRELDLPMKLVDIELLLGGERIIFHFASENWIDFRELVKRLAVQYQTRIEMHQVNARDEARLVADYEKCGQHCCCKQFLKVLKPVSMRSAKVQKATLDPTKISGRCGRLMCCLRYEDQTYEDLRKRLPHRQTRVMTADGPGTVIDSQILTQLILVICDTAAAPAAYPLENIEILPKDHPNFRPPEQRDDRPREGPRDRRPPEPRPPADQRPNPDARQSPDNRPPREPRRPAPGAPLTDHEVESREGPPIVAAPIAKPSVPAPSRTPPPPPSLAPQQDPLDNDDSGDGSDADDAGTPFSASDAPPPDSPPGQSSSPSDQPPGPDGQRRRRRRRRRGRGRGGPGNSGGPGAQGGPGAPGGGPPPPPPAP